MLGLKVFKRGATFSDTSWKPRKRVSRQGRLDCLRGQIMILGMFVVFRFVLFINLIVCLVTHTLNATKVE